MNLIKMGVKNEIVYKSNINGLQFTSSCAKILSYKKISDFFYLIELEPMSKGICIVSIADSDGNNIDEIALKVVIALPEEQYNYVDTFNKEN